MPKNFDYIIIGGGLAGLQLALEFSRDIFFVQKKIAIIDFSKKNNDDKTWCFWEKGEGKWEEIIFKKWESFRFVTSQTDKKFNLEPYCYKMIRSIDFYNYVKAELQRAENISFIQDEIEKIDQVTTIAHGKKNSYEARHFFDSRIDQEFEKDTKHTKIHQHFKGWVIETKNNRFDPTLFTIMDFRMKYENSTSFCYVLPFSRTEALVEFTFFTPFLTKEEVYDDYLKKYIETILNIEDYTIKGNEAGNIPMSDYPFHKKSNKKITKIGTAGSWVKGSTGYSFKHTEKKVAKIIKNIKKGSLPSLGVVNKRFRKYDAIFLDVLIRKNELGELLFTRFYTKNSPQQIFKYLDEETSLKEDLKIMFSLKHPEFIKSFFRKGLIV